MLQGDHSAILSTFIKLPFVIKCIIIHYFNAFGVKNVSKTGEWRNFCIRSRHFCLFEWRFYTGFTVHVFNLFLGLGLVMQNAGNFDGAVKQYTEIIKVSHFSDLNPKLNENSIKKETAYQNVMIRYPIWYLSTTEGSGGIFFWCA